MTIHKTPSEVAKAEMVKTLRAAVRLKHSLAADRELNEVLPAAEQAFDSAIQRGVLPSAIDVEGIVRSVVPE